MCQVGEMRSLFDFMNFEMSEFNFIEKLVQTYEGTTVMECTCYLDLHPKSPRSLIYEVMTTPLHYHC
jgi:hypothetical protein